jgi:hypothetical protein
MLATTTSNNQLFCCWLGAKKRRAGKVTGESTEGGVQVVTINNSNSRRWFNSSIKCQAWMMFSSWWCCLASFPNVVVFFITFDRSFSLAWQTTLKSLRRSQCMIFERLRWRDWDGKLSQLSGFEEDVVRACLLLTASIYAIISKSWRDWRNEFGWKEWLFTRLFCLFVALRSFWLSFCLYLAFLLARGSKQAILRRKNNLHYYYVMLFNNYHWLFRYYWCYRCYPALSSTAANAFVFKCKTQHQSSHLSNLNSNFFFWKKNW